MRHWIIITVLIVFICVNTAIHTQEKVHEFETTFNLTVPRDAQKQQRFFRCNQPSQLIELKRYEIVVGNNRHQLPLGDIIRLHRACSRQTGCLVPKMVSASNYSGQRKLRIQYKCLDGVNMKDMCGRLSGSYTSLDLFAPTKQFTTASTCSCVIKGRFKLSVVDIRLLDDLFACSPTTIDILVKDGCVHQSCLKRTYRCSERTKTAQGGVYFSRNVPLGAKLNAITLEVSLRNLKSQTQMVWFRIKSASRGEATAVACNLNTVGSTPLARNDETTVSPSKDADGQTDAAAIYVPVIVALLLIIAALAGFLLYKRARRKPAPDGKHPARNTYFDKLANVNKCGGTLLDNAAGVSVIGKENAAGNYDREEYCTIQEANVDTTLQENSTCDHYHETKDDAKTEHNKLEFNPTSIPQDCHITKINNFSKDNIYNHIGSRDCRPVDNTPRPRLEPPANVSTTKRNADPSIKVPNNLTLGEPFPREDIRDGGYSHLNQNEQTIIHDRNDGPDVSCLPENKLSSRKVEDIDYEKDTNNYFVLEQEETDNKQEDTFLNNRNPYFVLEKDNKTNSEECEFSGDAEQTNMKNSEFTHQSSEVNPIVQTEIQNNRDLSLEDEYFEPKRQRHTAEVHDYSVLENLELHKTIDESSHDYFVLDKET